MPEDVEIISNEYHDELVSEMIPCPFCGKKDGDVMVIHFHHWVCACRKCDAQGPVCTSPRKALQSWNKRRKK